MRVAVLIAAFLAPLAAWAQLDDTVIITPPSPEAPAPPPQPQPQPTPKPVHPPKPEPKPVAPTVAWASPVNGAVLFRPDTVTLDWTSAFPEGTAYSVTMGETKKDFPVSVAENVAATSVRWTLPDMPCTTVYLRVKAFDPSGALLGSDVRMIHLVPADAIVVSKQNQRLWAFHGGKLRQRYLISTGDVDYDTRAGWFTVYMRSRDHHSSIYDVDMPYALFFSGGQAIHASTALRRLGRRASHGCVRLPKAHARTLFDDSGVGRPIIVTPWGDDMSYLDAFLPASNAAGKPAPRVAGRQ
ncbi:MAG TPA: L,D-transpeptidase [Armatimonadota bacterium]|jgi:hypothetical protein